MIAVSMSGNWLMAAVMLSLGVAVVVEAWRRGVFDWRYLSTGPRRELEMLALDRGGRPGGVRWLGWVVWGAGLILALAGPWLSPLPALVVFVSLAAMERGGLWKVGLLPRVLGREVVWGFALTFPALILVFAANFLTGQIGAWLGDPPPPLGHESLQVMRDNPTVGVIFRLVLMAVIIAPPIEEACYRGLIQTLLLQRLGRHRRWIVVLLAAALFASIHVPVVTWHTLPGLFLLGTVFGMMYERTGSLWPGMVCHATFNALNLALVLAVPSGG